MPDQLRKHIRDLRQLERQALERGDTERATQLALIRKDFQVELQRRLEELGLPPEPRDEM